MAHNVFWGLIFPVINTPEQAQAAVEALRDVQSLGDSLVEQRRSTLQGTNISRQKWHIWVDDFPNFPFGGDMLTVNTHGGVSPRHHRPCQATRYPSLGGMRGVMSLARMNNYGAQNPHYYKAKPGGNRIKNGRFVCVFGGQIVWQLYRCLVV